VNAKELDAARTTGVAVDTAPDPAGSFFDDVALVAAALVVSGELVDPA
jgi:hypothetical protein